MPKGWDYREGSTVYFLIGRKLVSLGTSRASRTLRQWMTAGRAKHVRRTAQRTYEVFELQGSAYMSTTSLTPTILREMPANTYREFLGCIQVIALSMRFPEQVLERENGVTGSHVMAAAHT